MLPYAQSAFTMAYVVVVEVLLLLFMFKPTQCTKVSVTAPVNPVQVGRILSIHCEIRDLDGSHKVKLTREVGGKEEEVISVDKNLIIEDPATNERTFIAERHLVNGAVVFFLSIIDVAKEDEGEYLCKVVPSNLEGTIARHSVRVNLNYFPDESNPSCWPQEVPELIEGIPFTFNCSSAKGNPTVDISWSRGGVDIQSNPVQESSDGSSVYSALRFIPNLNDKGAILKCTIKSSTFPEEEPRYCHIGPLTIKANPNAPKHPQNKPANTIKPPDTKHTDIVIDDNVGGGKDTKTSTRPSAKCKEACSALSSPVFYWVMATVVAGLIAIVFLITGIILYIRYCRIVAQGKERRFTACRQSPDDVYEKLEYRKGDKTLYMSLDKHGMKTEVPGSVYGQTTEGVHYNMTPTHIRPQPQFS